MDGAPELWWLVGEETGLLAAVGLILGDSIQFR